MTKGYFRSGFSYTEIRRKIEKIVWRENIYCLWKQKEKRYIKSWFIGSGGGGTET